MAAMPAGLATALQGRYRLDRELGQGGMAAVYRHVALKVLRPELGAVLGAERFLREIQLTAKLQHPHIVTLIDSGEVRIEHPERSEGPLALLYYVLPLLYRRRIAPRAPYS